MPRKRDLRRVRRVRGVVAGGGCLVLLGIGAVIPDVGDSVGGPSGGWVRFAVCGVLVVVGLVPFIWGVRNEPRVKARELEELRLHGLDDGLPYGAYRDGQSVGLEAADLMLVFAACFAVMGLVVGVATFTDPKVAWGWAAGAVLVVLLPGVLLLRLGTGTRLWMTEEGIERRRWPAKSTRWSDVEQVVLTTVGTSDLIELRGRPESTGWRRHLPPPSFTIRCLPLEAESGDVLRLLRARVQS